MVKRPRRGGSAGFRVQQASGHDQGEGEDISKLLLAVAVGLSEAQERCADHQQHPPS